MKKINFILISLCFSAMLIKAQSPSYPIPEPLTNIVAAEYFFDNIVTFGNGTPLAIGPNLDINNLNININISSLQGGYHRLYIRTKDANGKWSITNTKSFFVNQDPTYPSAVSSSQIIAAEYFIDNMVAFGNGTPILLTPNSDINNLNININTNTLQGGYHRLYIRTKDSNGKWSITNTKRFYVDQDPVYPASNSLPQIVQAEYFFDQLNGFGSGTPITITPSFDIDSMILTLNSSLLCAGMHRVYIRTKDANNKWSITNTKLFEVTGSGNITALHYFFDNDPGINIAGNGSILTLPHDSVLSLNTNIVVPNNLSNGFHTLFVRTKNDYCVWSIAERSSFNVNPPKPPVTILAYQYFFDTDPGVGIPGNGAIINTALDSVFSGTLNLPIPTNLTAGFHNLFVRTLSNTGVWSIAERSSFFLRQDNTLQMITTLEYYFDNDPGIGNGTSFPITNTDSLNITANISTSGLPDGIHYLYVRAKDELNRWSIIERDTFNIFNGTPASCLNFDGVNDYVSLPNGGGLNNSATGTIEMWVKWNGTNQPSGFQSYGAVCGRQLNGVFSSHVIALNGANPQTAKIIWKPYSGNVNVLTSTISPDTVWNHIAITFNGNQHKMYINGVLEASATASGAFIPSSIPMTLGAWIGDGNCFSQCKIDELKIWNIERTQSEIHGNMNCETNSPQTGLLGLYHFNQGFVNTNNITENTLHNDAGTLNGSLQNFALVGTNSNWADLSPIINGIPCFSTLQIKLFIKGYYLSAGTMTPVLMNQGVSNNPLITDSIVVELKDAFSFQTIYQANTVISTQGLISINTPILTNSSGYYIVIKHRNGLQTWSANPINLSSLNSLYDFTIAGSNTYGANSFEIENGVWAFYSGDINQDENIDLLDLSLIENDINNFEYGYFATDINGDGNVDLLDMPTIEENIQNFIYSIHP